MELRGRLEINGHWIIFNFEYCKDEQYFCWWSNFNRLVYETFDRERIDQILTGIKKFSDNTTVDKNKNCILELINIWE